jgi:hypothetical protein
MSAVERQFPLDGFSQILYQMKTIGHLLGRWCAFTRGFAVPAVAISANRMDFRMRRQPLLNGLRGVLIQNVDHRIAEAVELETWQSNMPVETAIELAVEWCEARNEEAGSLAFP